MDEAQRKYILSVLSNEILKDPVKYGVRPDGSIRVGDTLDLSSLFKDTEKLKTIFAKAEKLTPDQKKSILENNKRISAWVKNHPTETLSTDKVNEILSSEPEEVRIEAPKIEVPKKEEDIQLGTYASIDEVAEVLANKKEKPKSELEEKFSTRSMAEDASTAQAVETAFTNEINSIYGKSGVLGLGKKTGLESKEWTMMGNLPMGKVLEYYTGDSVKSGLSPQIIDQLSKSEQHHALVKQILGLVEQTKGTMKPYDKETVAEFLKRLGGFVMKNHL